MRRSPLLVAALLCLPAASFASVVIAQSPAEQTQRADLVVHAQVLSSRVAWNAERTQIRTYTQLAVLQALKGASAKTIELVQPGGTLDGRTVAVQGNAQLEPGEELVLFLSRAGKSYVLLGMAASKYAVVVGPAGKQVVRNLQGLELVKLGPSGTATLPNPGIEQAGSLDALIATIRAAAR